MEIPVRNQHRFPGLVLAALSILPFAAQAAPKPSHQPVALIPFTAGQGSGVGMVINNQGMVCGMLLSGTGAFCWRAGKLVELQPLPGDYNVVVNGINDRGQAVGYSQTDITFRRRAVVFVDGVATELPIPASTSSSAAGIDNGGDIAGTYTNRAGEDMAFLYRHGSVVDLGTLGSTVRSSSAADINNGKQVVGTSFIDSPTPNGSFESRAFTVQHGDMQALPTPAGYSGIGTRVNERGQVVGWIESNDNPFDSQRAALWDKGRLKVLLDQPSHARGINNRGEVVGAVLISGSSGFFYEPGKDVRSLNDLIDTSTGWSIVYAQAINDRGQIVGLGCKGQLCGPVLLDPVHGDHAQGKQED
jgi:probable HAF family extracellular repeat protein